MKKTGTVLTTLLSSLCFASLAHAQTPAPAASAPNTAESTAPSTNASVAPEEPSPRATDDTKDSPTRARSTERSGFYLRLLSGPGVLSLKGNGPGGTASLLGASSAGSLVIGGSIARGLVLAGTISGSMAQATFKGGPLRNATLTVDGTTASASHKANASFGELGLLVDWYPNPAAGWHTGLSAGLGVVTINNDADDSSLVGIDPAGSIFGGYDVSLGRDWSLGLSLALSGGTTATMKHSSGGEDAGYRLTPVSASVQASLLYF